MKLTRDTAIGIFNELTALKDEKVSVTTAMKMTKNKRISKVFFDEMEEVQQRFSPLTAKLQEKEGKRIEICKDLCIKDDNGNPISRNNQYIFPPENQTELQSRLSALHTEYESEEEEKNKFIKEIENLLQEEVEADFILIPIAELPKEMTSKQYETLLPIIEE